MESRKVFACLGSKKNFPKRQTPLELSGRTLEFMTYGLGGPFFNVQVDLGYRKDSLVYSGKLPS